MAEDNPQLPPEVQQALKNDAAKSASSNPKTQRTQQEPTASHQTDQVQTVQYPSEVVDLPSQGWFYDPTSPLYVQVSCTCARMQVTVRCYQPAIRGISGCE